MFAVYLNSSYYSDFFLSDLICFYNCLREITLKLSRREKKNRNSMDSSGIPTELKEKLTAFDLSLSEVEKNLKPLLDVPQNELNEKVKLDCK